MNNGLEQYRTTQVAFYAESLSIKSSNANSKTIVKVMNNKLSDTNQQLHL